MTGSNPRHPLFFHYMVCKKYNSYSVGINPLLSKELIIVFSSYINLVPGLKVGVEYGE